MIVKRAETGVQYQIQIDGTFTVEKLKHILSEKTGLPVDRQILLKDGATLKDNFALSSYNINHNTENVFLFDKLSSTNYIPEEPPTPPQIPEFRYEVPQISDQMGQSPLITTLLKYKTQFATDWNFVKQFEPVFQSVLKICAEYSDQGETQIKALKEVFNHFLKTENDIRNNFQIYVDREVAEIQKNREILLSSFNSDLQKLKEMKLHPALVTSERKNLVDIFTEARLVRWADECYTQCSKYQKDIDEIFQQFLGLRNSIDKSTFISDQEIYSVKEKLEELTLSYKKFVTYISKFEKDYKLIEASVLSSNKNWENVEAYKSIQMNHTNDIESLKEIHSIFVNHFKIFVAWKKRTSLWFYQNFKDVPNYEKKINDIKEACSRHMKTYPKLKESFNQLKSLHKFPEAYQAVLKEISRRRSYQRKVTEFINKKLTPLLTKARIDEIDKRKHFINEWGSYFPNNFIPGLMDPPGLFELSPANETELPDIDIDGFEDKVVLMLDEPKQHFEKQKSSNLAYLNENLSSKSEPVQDYLQRISDLEEKLNQSYLKLEQHEQTYVRTSELEHLLEQSRVQNEKLQSLVHSKEELLKEFELKLANQLKAQSEELNLTKSKLNQTTEEFEKTNRLLQEKTNLLREIEEKQKSAQDSLEEIQTNRQTLELQLKENEELLANYQSEIEKVRKELEQYKVLANQNESKVNQSIFELETKSKKEKEISAKIEKLESEMKLLKTENSQKENQLTSLQEEHAKKIAQIQTLQAEQTESLKHLKQFQEEKSKYETEINSLREKLSVKEAQLNSLSDQINEKETIIKTCQQDLLKEKELYQKLQEEYNHKQSMLQSQLAEQELNSSSLFRNLEDASAKKDAKLKALEETLASKETQLKNLREDVKHRETETKILKDEIKTLKESLASKETQLKSFGEDLKNRETETKSLKDEIKSLKEALTMKEAQMKSKGEELNKKEEEIKSLKESLSQQTVALKTFTEQVKEENVLSECKLKSLDEELNKEKAKLVSLQDTLHSKEEEIKKKEKELDSCKSELKQELQKKDMHHKEELTKKEKILLSQIKESDELITNLKSQMRKAETELLNQRKINQQTETEFRKTQEELKEKQIQLNHLKEEKGILQHRLDESENRYKNLHLPSEKHFEYEDLTIETEKVSYGKVCLFLRHADGYHYIYNLPNYILDPTINVLKSLTTPFVGEIIEIQDPLRASNANNPFKLTLGSEYRLVIASLVQRKKS